MKNLPYHFNAYANCKSCAETAFQRIWHVNQYHIGNKSLYAGIYPIKEFFFRFSIICGMPSLSGY